MKVVIYDKVNMKFKVVLVISIGILLAVVALGEMGII